MSAPTADRDDRGPWTAQYPSLRGKRVLITGGGTGIGEFIVEAFALQGARVAFIDIQAEPSRALVSRLEGRASPVRFIEQDLTDVAATQAATTALVAEWKGIDILINNAANDDRHQIADVTPAYWNERLAVNLTHYFFCAQSVLPSMKAAGTGVIVNVGSISWHLGLPDIAVYQTAKAGIEGLTRAMARDLGTDGIRVTCVVPGGIRTERQMALWHDEAEETRMLGQQCLKARVLPQDVAAMILFLASDDARMCTAHNYFVDAGWR
ncbi:MAG: SDR family oxidoreductase [Acidobacteria bacterium]|nr:SDR family oxidoreductase [Acidobacteriota bacterium]